MEKTYVFSLKDNNPMILIACRKVHFKTCKLKCHAKVILLFFLLLCCFFKPLVMVTIKWSHQVSTILNLPGMYNVRSTLVLGFRWILWHWTKIIFLVFVINVRNLMPDLFWPCNIALLVV